MERSDMRGVQCTRRTGDSKCLIDGGNLGITQQHESVHQNEGVVAIEGRGEGWKGKDKEQCTKLQPLLRDCERATGGE